MTGTKYDSGKPMLALTPPESAFFGWEAAEISVRAGVLSAAYLMTLEWFHCAPNTTLEQVWKALVFLDPHLHEHWLAVSAKGAEKYGLCNWQEVQNARMRYTSALLRHLKAELMGQEIDPDWDFPHLWHSACNLMFLMWFEKTGKWT